MDHLMVLSDVLNFLQFSEKNIEQQKPLALAQLETEIEEKDIDEEHRYAYRTQMIEAANFRFDVALPMRVRYAALTAFTSTIEWSIAALHPAFEFPPKPAGKSETVHRLTILSERCRLNYASHIDCLEFLIWVRNSIMHNAGTLRGYQHAAEIRRVMPQFEPSFTISNWHHIGDTVEIKRGALEPIIRTWSDAIRELFTVATRDKLVRFD
jgi:hypothetical protein